VIWKQRRVQDENVSFLVLLLHIVVIVFSTALHLAEIDLGDMLLRQFGVVLPRIRLFVVLSIQIYVQQIQELLVLLECLPGEVLCATDVDILGHLLLDGVEVDFVESPSAWIPDLLWRVLRLLAFIWLVVRECHVVWQDCIVLWIQRNSLVHFLFLLPYLLPG